MKLLKDRKASELCNSEIISVAFEQRLKFLASCAFEEPVLIYRYPYMKLVKKISHRSKIPVIDEFDLLSQENHSDLEDISPNTPSTDESNKIFIKGPIITPTKILFGPNSQLIIAYRNGDVLVYDVAAWKKRADFEFESEITSMEFVQNKSLLFLTTANWDTYLIDTKTWKIETTKHLNITNTGTAIITNSMDKIYVISDKKRVRSVDFNTMEEIHTFKGHKSGINMIRLSPDEKILATSGNDGKISLFDTNTGELITFLIGHSDEVHSFVFSPKGDYLVSSSEDDSIRLWDIQTYKCVKIVKEVPNAFAMEIFDELLVMGNVEGEIQTFKMF